ncbi:MAG TPA: T9SS type A sorting domain-containing protein [Candidatus Kapabacteria bacterium]|nr:T9SS type A sorting domain-containing protein [Candidatus Kapabacteria bacterium]
MRFILYTILSLIMYSTLLFAQPSSNEFAYGTEFDKISISSSVEADTNTSNKIVQVWTGKDDLNVKIKVSDKSKQINITVYNMLGKEIIKVYEGVHNRDDEAYTVNVSLPNGIYICVLRGDTFRSAEKFIVSR